MNKPVLSLILYFAVIKSAVIEKYMPETIILKLICDIKIQN